jgi:hypothetical protein
VAIAPIGTDGHVEASAQGTSVTSALPSGFTFDGTQLCLLQVSYGSGTPSPGTTITTPGGWTLLTQPVGTSTRIAVFWRFLQAGDSAPSFTLGATRSWCAHATAFSGVDTTTPINSSDGGLDYVAATSYTTNSLTPTANGCMIVVAWGGKTGTGLTQTVTIPSGWTDTVGGTTSPTTPFQSAIAAVNNNWATFQYQQQGTAAAISESVTVANSATAESYVIALTPAAAAADPNQWTGALWPTSGPTGPGRFFRPWWSDPVTSQTFSVTVSVAATGTSSDVEQVGKTLGVAATGAEADLEQVAKTLGVAVTGTEVDTAQVGKTLGVSVAGAVATLATKVKLVTVAVAATGAAAVSRQVGKLASATSSAGVTTRRAVSKTVPVSVAGAVSTVATKVKLLTVSVAATGSAAVTRSVGKLTSAAAAGTPAVVRQAGKRAAVAATSSVATVRQAGKLASASASAAVTTSALKVKLLTIAVAASASASVSRTVGKLAQLTASGAPSVARQVSRKVSIAVSATVGSLAQRVKLVTIAVAASGAVTVRRGVGKLAAAASSVAVAVARVPSIVQVFGKRLEVGVAQAVSLAASALSRATPTGTAGRSEDLAAAPGRTASPEATQTGHGLVEKDPDQS